MIKSLIPKVLVTILIIILMLAIRSQSDGGEPGAEGDGANPIMLFILYIALAFVIGFAVIGFVLPFLGDRVSAMFYTSNEKPDVDPMGAARALVARGEYEDAIREFRKISLETPDDRSPIVEIIKIYEDKLDNPEAAISTIEQALDSEAYQWDDDDTSFFHFRLVDLNVESRRDFARARSILEQVIAKFPETRQAANAHHKMRMIDDAEFKAGREQDAG